MKHGVLIQCFYLGDVQVKFITTNGRSLSGVTDGVHSLSDEENEELHRLLVSHFQFMSLWNQICGKEQKYSRKWKAFDRCLKLAFGACCLLLVLNTGLLLKIYTKNRKLKDVSTKHSNTDMHKRRGQISMVIEVQVPNSYYTKNIL